MVPSTTPVLMIGENQAGRFARRDEPRLRKFLLDCVYAKEMIAVAVGCVDCRQILAAVRDPVDKFLVLIDRNRRVHQHGIALARNKRRRNGRPFHSLAPGEGRL